MKTEIAIYDTQEKAINAIKLLAKNDFPMRHLSLLGKTDVTDEDIEVQSLEPVKNAPLLVGAGAGAIIGLLSGIGIFAIPGFGFLYGAGALIGAIGGADLGIITGGIGTVLLTAGIDKDNVVKYNEHLDEGKILLLVNGPIEEIEKAKNILQTADANLEFSN